MRIWRNGRRKGLQGKEIMKLYYSGDGTRAYISSKQSDNK